MEASDILQFISRFSQNDFLTNEAGHYLVKFWNEGVRRIGAHTEFREEGQLSLLDFCQLVLPLENVYLRATATQRPSAKADDICFLVEK